MRISDWSSDVCSSDLLDPELPGRYASEKKAALSSAAAKLCAGETIATPEVKERALSWIPDAMSFRAAETPHEPEEPAIDDDGAEDQPAIDDAGDEQADELDLGVTNGLTQPAHGMSVGRKRVASETRVSVGED